MSTTNPVVYSTSTAQDTMRRTGRIGMQRVAAALGVCANQGTCEDCGRGVECDLPAFHDGTCILDGCWCGGWTA